MSAPLPRDGVACQRDPERWFDKAERRFTLQHCLACPVRRWCAEEALAGATYGMWAGIWIEDNLAEVAHHLRAVTDNPTADGSPLQPTLAVTQANPAEATESATPAPLSADGDAVAHRLRTVVRTRAHRAALAAIWARSCGHCELMTPACRFTLDALGSRAPGQGGWDVEHAADAFAACRPCLAAVSLIDRRLAQRLGYLVEVPFQPGFTPFFWRQARWVYLDGGPKILETESPKLHRRQAN